VTELSYAAGKAITDLPEGVRPSEVAEWHGNELTPGSEFLGVSLYLVPIYEPLEILFRKLLKKLIE